MILNKYKYVLINIYMFFWSYLSFKSREAKRLKIEEMLISRCRFCVRDICIDRLNYPTSSLSAAGKYHFCSESNDQILQS